MVILSIFLSWLSVILSVSFHHPFFRSPSSSSSSFRFAFSLSLPPSFIIKSLPPFHHPVLLQWSFLFLSSHLYPFFFYSTFPLLPFILLSPASPFSYPLSFNHCHPNVSGLKSTGFAHRISLTQCAENYVTIFHMMF